MKGPSPSSSAPPLPVEGDGQSLYEVPEMTALGAPAFHASEVLRWVASTLEPWSSPIIVASSAPALEELFFGDVASAWGLRSPRGGRSSRFASAARLAVALERSKLGRTTIWPHGQSWFVAGEHAEELQSCLAKHCPKLELARPRFVPELARRLRERRNPWQRRPRWFAELSHDALNECGVRLDSAVWFWLSAVMMRDSEGFDQQLTGSAASLATRAREQLSTLLERRFELSEAQAWIIFVLRAARDSDLVVLRARDDFTAWSAVAHLGGSRVIRLRYTRYGLDDAANVSITSDPVSRHRYETHLDGGDVHCRILELDEVELLEGCRSATTPG